MSSVSPAPALTSTDASEAWTSAPAFTSASRTSTRPPAAAVTSAPCAAALGLGDIDSIWSTRCAWPRLHARSRALSNSAAPPVASSKALRRRLSSPPASVWARDGHSAFRISEISFARLVKSAAQAMASCPSLLRAVGSALSWSKAEMLPVGLPPTCWIATCRGVSLSSLAKPGSARLATSRRTAPSWAPCAARCSGVSPSVARALGSARSSRRASMADAAPWPAALWSAVQPKGGVLASTSVPAATSARTSAALSSLAAAQSGVSSPFAAGSTSAVAAIVARRGRRGAGLEEKT
mmetsp:Transcript_52028/g.146599  ORF Transcript_52028/g.146599 Transcript_52028/m.146599 type:complete len:295 (+) Transcript_52028:600-1484(+)